MCIRLYRFSIHTRLVSAGLQHTCCVCGASDGGDRKVFCEANHVWNGQSFGPLAPVRTQFWKSRCTRILRRPRLTGEVATTETTFQEQFVLGFGVHVTSEHVPCEML